MNPFGKVIHSYIRVKCNQNYAIKQKGMPFDHNFCYSFSIFSLLFFLGGKRKGEENNKTRGQKYFLFARPIMRAKSACLETFRENNDLD